ncbi:hypothetical protein [Tolypothrix sp. VBCCA 56010]
MPIKQLPIALCPLPYAHCPLNNCPLPGYILSQQSSRHLIYI